MIEKELKINIPKPKIPFVILKPLIFACIPANKINQTINSAKIDKIGVEVRININEKQKPYVVIPIKTDLKSGSKITLNNRIINHSKNNPSTSSNVDLVRVM